MQDSVSGLKWRLSHVLQSSSSPINFLFLHLAPLCQCGRNWHDAFFSLKQQSFAFQCDCVIFEYISFPTRGVIDASLCNSQLSRPGWWTSVHFNVITAGGAGCVSPKPSGGMFERSNHLLRLADCPERRICVCAREAVLKLESVFSQFL